MSAPYSVDERLASIRPVDGGTSFKGKREPDLPLNPRCRDWQAPLGMGRIDAAARSDSIRRSQPSIRFQLVKFRLTT